VDAIGDVIHAGSRVATAEGKLVAEETGKLLAHATTTALIMR
jgi:acyl-coenzyme A thioesterase PaaI-like protein